MTKEPDTISVPVIGWFDQPAKKAINSVFDGINEGIEARDLFRTYRKAHFKSLREQVNSIKILGMSTPVKLKDIYEPSMVSTTIHRRLYEQELFKVDEQPAKETEIERRKSRYRRKVLEPADSFVERCDRVVVLGGPGSGKTTLLRYLAHAYSSRAAFRSSNLERSKLPLFVRLPEVAKEGTTIESFVSKQLVDKTDKYAAAFLRRVFKNGLAILILDSLDEVPTENRSRIDSQIRGFCDKYPDCKIVVSCRTADYESIGESFYEVELAHLTNSAIVRIIKGWFGGDDEKASSLLQHIKHDDDIAQLTETPLLLSLLCIQFHHDLALPKRKAELYGRCIDALLRDWDASRNFRRDTEYEALSDDRKERLFEHVADHFFSPTPRYAFPEKEVAREIGSYCGRFGIESGQGNKILLEIERHHGLLEKVSKSSYSFSHPSIHEFFVGRCALSRRTDLSLVKEHFENENWASVIEFIVALREDPEELVDYMLKKSSMSKIKTYPAMARRTKNLWLLYRCLAGGAALTSNTKMEVYEYIVEQQKAMSNVYYNGGVMPFASLLPDGVSHSYYYFKKRPTLAKTFALLRKLGNAIYSAPSPRYARLALDAAIEVGENVDTTYPAVYRDISLALLLAVPVANQHPGESVELLASLKKTATTAGLTSHFHNWIDGSIVNLDG